MLVLPRWCRGGFYAAALMCAAFCCFACGPIEYVNQVTRRASSEVDAAKAMKADKHAPYWYTLAVEYLHKAREEAAAADFQAANRFGRRSAEAARKARALAKERAADPTSRPRVPALREVDNAEGDEDEFDEAPLDDAPLDDAPLDDAPLDDAEGAEADAEGGE